MNQMQLTGGGTRKTDESHTNLFNCLSKDASVVLVYSRSGVKINAFKLTSFRVRAVYMDANRKPL
jgi:hypothetical protein